MPRGRRTPAKNAACLRCARLDRQVRELKSENRKLRDLLDEARRAAKRQACPFSKGSPKRRPKKPGRKPGAAYGRRASRPKPRHVDQVLEARLPEKCPHCGGAFCKRRVESQWQHDLPPVTPIVTQFNVHVAECEDCGHRVQGRHPLQTSDALGAAANQIGPRALALAAQLNKEVGVPYGRIRMLLRRAFGLGVSKATLVRGLERVAARAEPLYANIEKTVRESKASTWDETGWRIGGHRAWLWAGAAALATLYRIRRSRGFSVPAEVLGNDYRGGLVADGWAIYDRFCLALRQFCLQHPLRRCVELLQTATRGAVRFPRQVKRWIEDAFSLRDRRDEGRLSAHGLSVAIGHLAGRMRRLLAWTRANRDNERFAKHLAAHEPFLLNFLRYPWLDGTNYRGEQALRPAVITRKVSGGNRTDAGAHAQEVLASYFRTCWQQDLDSIDLLVRVLRAPDSATVARLAFTDTG